MNRSDRNNPRRLVRAIEIVKNKKIQPRLNGLSVSKPINAMVHFIGLDIPNEALYEKIDQRVDRRIEQGMIDEIKNVLKKGYTENFILFYFLF